MNFREVFLTFWSKYFIWFHTCTFLNVFIGSLYFSLLPATSSEVTAVGHLSEGCTATWTRGGGGGNRTERRKTEPRRPAAAMDCRFWCQGNLERVMELGRGGCGFQWDPR